MYIVDHDFNIRTRHIINGKSYLTIEIKNNVFFVFDDFNVISEGK